MSFVTPTYKIFSLFLVLYYMKLYLCTHLSLIQYNQNITLALSIRSLKYTVVGFCLFVCINT